MLTEKEKAYRRAHYRKNIAAATARAKKWATDNPDRRKEISLAWYYRNRDSQLAKRALWYQTEAGKASTARGNRAHRIKSPDRWARNMAKKALYRRTGLPCEYLDPEIVDAEIARLRVLKLVSEMKR